MARQAATSEEVVAGEGYSHGAPTVLLAVFDGLGARYLLRTDILPVLREAGAELVIVSPNADEPYFRKEFAAPGVRLERLDVEGMARRFEGSRLERSARLVRRFTLDQSEDLSTLDAIYRAHKQQRGRRAERLLVGGAIHVLRRSRQARRLLVALEERFFVDRSQEHIFERHSPAVVVTTTVGHTIYDAYIMRLARRRGVQVMTVLLSWDHTTKWGIGGVRPDRVAVWSETLKAGLVRGQDVKSEKVVVVGVPHFDAYARSRPSQSREAFLASHGLSSDRRVILFGTRPPGASARDARTVEILCRAIVAGELSHPCQLLVRVHPRSRRADQGAATRDGLIRALTEIQAWCPHLHINEPTILSGMIDADMPGTEMAVLHSLLRYSDVLVNSFSTLNIEACIHDLPTVNVIIDEPGEDGDESPVERTLDIGDGHAHNRRILRLDFTRIARSPSDLIAHVNLYLANPDLDRLGRERVVAQECGPMDGRAGRRVAEEILRLCEGVRS